MKNIFKYTFTTVAELKKFLIVVLIVSILTLIEAFPVISIVGIILEKLIFLSIGGVLIYILNNTKSSDEFFHNLKIQPISSFLFHFIPSAIGILVGMFVIFAFWSLFFVFLMQFSGSMYLLADPHSFLMNFQNASAVVQLIFSIYFIYLMFFSYIFLGKLGEALEKDTFKGAFVAIITALIDFKFWIKTFNLRYFVIYLVWSFIVFTIFVMLAFGYLFYIFPMIVSNPSISLIVIPLFVAITTIITYFTFFSAYFAYKTTKEEN